MRTAPIFIALLCLVACEKNEAADAPRLASAIAGAQPSFAATNAAEQELIRRSRAWCNVIVAAGAGHDVALDRNTAAATEYSRTAAAIAQRIDELRQSLLRVRLRSEEPRRVRADLVAQLLRRRAALQAFHTELEQTVSQFRAFAQDRDYTGDTVPDRIRAVDATVGAWPAPEDILSPALAALRLQ